MCLLAKEIYDYSNCYVEAGLEEEAERREGN